MRGCYTDVLMEAQPVLGRFKIKKILKEGPHKGTYLATDPYHSDRFGVVRLIQRDDTSPPERDRLRHECALLAHLRDPNIASGLDFGEVARGPYLFSEYAPGRPLLPLPPHLTKLEWIGLLAQIIRGLHYLHTHGVIHGDLTPKNILVNPEVDSCEEGSVQLIDYGLCDRKSRTLTHEAPELFEGAAPSVASDLYALGVTLYQCLTNKLPFPCDPKDPGKFLETKLDPPWHRRLCRTLFLKGGMERFCGLLMNPDPAQRPSSVAEVADEISRLFGTPITLETKSQFYDKIHRAKFIGHVAFCEELLAHLEQGRSVWIWGPRGRGKSRLLEEIRWVVDLKGWTTIAISGRCPRDRSILHTSGPVPLVTFWDDYKEATHPKAPLNTPMLFCVASHLPPPPVAGWAALELPSWPRHDMEFFLLEIDSPVPLETPDIAHIHRLTRGHPGDVVVLLQVLFDRAQGMGLANPATFQFMEQVYQERRFRLAALEVEILKGCVRSPNPLPEKSILRSIHRPQSEVRETLRRLVAKRLLIARLDEFGPAYTLGP